MEREWQFHREARIDALTASGLSRVDAERQARMEFGDPLRWLEQGREARGLRWLTDLDADLRYALRQLRRAPGFTAVAVSTLALGIGANSAIFQVLDAIVLRPLPVRAPEQLVKLQGYHNGRGMIFSYPLLREMDARQTTVEGIFASASLNIRDSLIAGRAPVEPVAAWVATGNYFRVLGTEPQHGRFFNEKDDDTPAPPVAVISDAFWRREFGARLDALGQPIRINGVDATIVGVTKREFDGERVGAAVDLWLPISFAGQLSSPSSLTASSAWLQPMARIRADVPLKQAQAELSLLWDQLKGFNIQTRGVTEYRLELLPAHQGLGSLHSQFSRSLWLLMGIVGLLALLTSCNLANLLLARATARTREISVRLAIGAGRSRLIRQLLTESLILCVIGGGLGLVLAAVSSRQLIALASAGETWRLSMNLDWRVAGFTAMVSLAAVCIFGLAPALTATRIGLNTVLQGHSRMHTRGRSGRLATKAFVVSQVALSFVLVAAALLLVRSFWNLTRQDFGFQPDHVVFAKLTGDDRNVRQLMDRDIRQVIYRRMNEIPGVLSAAVGTGILGEWSAYGVSPIALSDRTLSENDGVRIVPVSPRYVETMSIPMLRGRSISDDDGRTTKRVAVISETAARLMFGSADPLGGAFASGTAFPSQVMFEIVGVMKDHKFGSPSEPFGPLVFVPLLQWPASGSLGVILRITGNPVNLASPLQGAIQEVAPGFKVGQLTPLRDLVRTAARRERLVAWLSGVFGVLGLVLASLGLYGVVSYGTERRTQEIGIRMALGARVAQIRRAVLTESLATVSIGILIGLAAAISTTRYLESLLFGISSSDPVTIVGTAFLMLAGSALASYVPARRASRVDPLVALRSE
jgi:predicted permease